MRAKLVGVPGSHPCISAELMLRYKGVEFSRMDLPNMTHKAILPLMRYRGSTVPVMTHRRQARSSGTMKIARALEALVPEPPMFGRTDAIEGDEAWADSVLQDGVRQLARYGDRQGPGGDGELPHRPLLGIPAGVVKRALPVMRPVVALPDAARAEATARGVPGRAARPARPRRRAARGGRDRRRAAERRRLPGRAVACG